MVLLTAGLINTTSGVYLGHAEGHGGFFSTKKPISSQNRFKRNIKYRLCLLKATQMDNWPDLLSFC